MLACFLLVSLPLLLVSLPLLLAILAPFLFSLAIDSASALLEPDLWNPTDRIGTVIYPPAPARPVRALALLPTFPRPLSRDVVASVRALRSPVRTNRLAA
jgi:hypothetical protein